MDAFEMLGLKKGADREEVHRAYRDLAKQMHPDQYPEGSEEQKAAQEKMIRLNLAYEDAVRQASGGNVTPLRYSAEEAVRLAWELYEKKNYTGALMKLQRSEMKTAEWYYLEGRILLSIKEYSTAHQAFREAVRMDPDNNDYRRGALEAAVAMKKHKKLIFRVTDWVDGVVRPRQKL